MDDNFSPRVKDVIAISKEEALRLGHNFIGTEHLMLGILRDGGGNSELRGKCFCGSYANFCSRFSI